MSGEVLRVKSREEIEKMKKELQEAIREGPLGANERAEIFASGMIFALQWVLGELEEAKE
jgi:N-acyl-D-aspartate/D-glutamate deacylase